MELRINRTQPVTTKFLRISNHDIRSPDLAWLKYQVFNTNCIVPLQIFIIPYLKQNIKWQKGKVCYAGVFKSINWSVIFTCSSHTLVVNICCFSSCKTKHFLNFGWKQTPFRNFTTSISEQFWIRLYVKLLPLLFGVWSLLLERTLWHVLQLIITMKSQQTTSVICNRVSFTWTSTLFCTSFTGRVNLL